MIHVVVVVVVVWEIIYYVFWPMAVEDVFVGTVTA
jgi:hypothetical protein